jgi:FKBP-type peptidyl-prolyl cis-trans isomerase
LVLHELTSSNNRKQVTDIEKGSGPAAAIGDDVKVHYVGKLLKTGV